MKAIEPLVPSFGRFQEEMKLNAVKFLATAAVANMLFQAYHFRKSQAVLNAGYFTGLNITDDAIRNGIIADNVESTRGLSRDVQGNLQESSRILKELNELVNGRKKEARGLKETVNSLRGTVSDLESTRKKFEATNQNLERIVDTIEERSKYLKQQIDKLNALKQEIAKTQGGEDVKLPI